MPIAPFLVMLGKKDFLMTIIKRPNSEISYQTVTITMRSTTRSARTLERVKYNAAEQAVTMTEPEVARQPITTFVTNMLDRLRCFIEETTASVLKTHLPKIQSGDPLL